MAAQPPMEGKPVPPERQAQVPTCQVCGEPLRDRAVVECRKCHTLHHLECWRFNKGCAMYACGCRSSVKPRSGDETAARGDFQYESRNVETSAKSLVILAVALVGAMGTGGLFNSKPAVLAGILAGFGGFLYHTIRFAIARDKFRVDGAQGAIHRTLRAFGRNLKVKERWLEAEDIVELHVHRTPMPHGPHFAEWRIYALLRDGSRRLVYVETVSTISRKDEELVSLAERLAVFADCTVREFEGKTGPSEAEIQEAITQRRLAREAEAAAALPAPNAAIPAPTDPAADPLRAAPMPALDPPPAEGPAAEERRRESAS